jgi:hypothetical protein
MPRELLNRIGVDTLAKLEAAATRRYAEAGRLAADEPLGALYLYGYTIEMRLKAAYYRLVGVAENWDIETPVPPNQSSPRKVAQNQIKQLLGPNSPNQVGHHLPGWAFLLINTRSTHVLGAFAPDFETALGNHVKAAARHWKETLRYRANRPYNSESSEVAAAARWIKTRYRRLWS